MKNHQLCRVISEQVLCSLPVGALRFIGTMKEARQARLDNSEWTGSFAVHLRRQRECRLGGLQVCEITEF
jgi:hypothetical protein